MDFNKYTSKANEAIYQSQQIAREHFHQAIEPIHLLSALISQPDGIVPALITKIAGHVSGLMDTVKKDLDSHPKISGAIGEIGLSSQAVQVLEAAERFSKGMQDDYTSTEHILLALLESPEGKILNQFGLTKDSVLKALLEVRGNQRVTSQNPEDTYQSLENEALEIIRMLKGLINAVLAKR